MGLGGLSQRVAALLVATGLLAVSVASVSADNGDEETAVAAIATELRPTQVVAEIPEGYEMLFPLQWGGGSLYQLKARLATMGCMLNTIWVYNNDQWHSYNQYNIPARLNQKFLAKFEDDIPSGTLHADCFDICTFTYHGEERQGECRSFEELQRSRISGFATGPDFEKPEHIECDNNFFPFVQERILNILPIQPDACAVKGVVDETFGYRAFAKDPYTYFKDQSLDNLGIPYVDNVSFFYLLWMEPSNAEAIEDEVAHGMAELHELCHLQQYWYTLQRLQPDIKEKSWYAEVWTTNSPAGQEFISLVDFEHRINEQGDVIWTLPQDSLFQDIYSVSPLELSAELCAIYLANKVSDVLGNFQFGRKDSIEYLTPEIKQWLETYMILPSIEEDAE